MSVLKDCKAYKTYLDQDSESIAALPAYKKTIEIIPGEIFCRVPLEDGSLCLAKLSSTNNLRKHISSHKNSGLILAQGPSGRISTDSLSEAKVFYQSLLKKDTLPPATPAASAGSRQSSGSSQHCSKAKKRPASDAPAEEPPAKTAVKHESLD